MATLLATLSGSMKSLSDSLVPSPKPDAGKAAALAALQAELDVNEALARAESDAQRELLGKDKLQGMMHDNDMAREMSMYEATLRSSERASQSVRPPPTCTGCFMLDRTGSDGTLKSVTMPSLFKVFPSC